MNVNPFSYLIEKLKSKLDKSGGTIKGTTDAPLAIEGSSVGSWLDFKTSGGTTVGAIGVKNDNKPYFYDTSAKRIALMSDIQKVYDASTADLDTLLPGGLSAIYIKSGTVIADYLKGTSVTMPNNMRGYAVKDGTTIIGYVSTFNLDTMYYIGCHTTYNHYWNLYRAI